MVRPRVDLELPKVRSIWLSSESRKFWEKRENDVSEEQMNYLLI